MKKSLISRITKILGVFLIALAGLKIASFGSFTGFAISTILQNSQFYIGYIFLFFLGITMFVSGDYLQEYLAEKEQESSSPSLEGRVQTEEERVHFKKRFSEGLIGRLFGKNRVSRVEQDKDKYTIGSNYQDPKIEPLTEEQKYIERTYSVPYNRKAIDDVGKEVAEIRKDLIKNKKRMDVASEEGDFADSSFGNYLSAAKKLKSEYDNLQNLIAEKLRIQHGDPKDVKFSQNVLDAYSEIRTKRGINALQNGARQNRRALSTEDFLEPLDSPTSQQILKDYFENALTIPIKEYLSNKKTILTHAVPSSWKHGPTSNTRRRISSEEGNGSAALYFLDQVFKGRDNLMLSATVASQDSPKMDRFGNIGVIFNDGKIYDLSLNDMRSQGLADGTRLRGAGGTGADMPIKFRQGGREAIVGKYSIGGIFVPSTLEKENPSLAREIAQKALEEEVGLYITSDNNKMGPSLLEVDPKKIIKRSRLKKV